MKPSPITPCAKENLENKLLNNFDMKKIILIIVLIIVGIAIFLIFNYRPVRIITPATNFEECVARGYPVLESYPRQCKTPDGKTYAEDIGNELEKQDLIRISVPRPNTPIKSPLLIQGEARGYWYFEASFPIKLFDTNGKLLGTALAQAKSDWMTENFVPFEALLEFEAPTTNKGNLILEKDNPSGLPENADELRVPVNF